MNKFNKEEFGSLLKTAIGSTRTITEFSTNCNVARPYISKFLNCKLDKAPSEDIINKFSQNARNGITKTDFLIAAGYIEDPQLHLIEEIESIGNDTVDKKDLLDNLKYDEIYRKSKQKDISPIKVPVLKYIENTVNLINENDENISHWLYVTSDEVTNNETPFYLMVDDNSMSNARILEGDLVFVLQQSYGNNGDIVVVMIEGESYIRRFNKVNNIIMFQAENAEFDSFAYLNSEFKNSNIKVLGKIAHIKSNLNFK